MTLQITTLCENTATFGYKAEWGLSMLVNYNDFTFLLDTGMTDIGVQNGLKHNIDFKSINSIVLSHGHLDHTGGLSYFLEHTGPVNVIGHPDIFNRKFSTNHQAPDDDISMPFTKNEYEKMGALFTLAKDPVEIAPGIITSGEVKMETPFEKLDSSLLSETPKNQNSKRVLDNLNDDLSIAISTPKGLFILLGCAHKGPVNIIKHFIKITGEKRVYGVAGGLHMSRANEQRIKETSSFFKECGINKVASSHCTGFNATSYLSKEFQTGFIHNNSGKKLIFDEL
ncbi:MAG: MBL fold metallo-hydrolase [Deltaproteobacteria bacterium]|nr:MBL fold metallo-hydrolase [Deltaproteobacteria bacterium]